MFGDNKTYTDDLSLFRELGLKPFVFSERDTSEHELGVVKINDATIKVFVACYPAQFWRFEITDSEGNFTNLSTGSGKMSDFWSSVDLFSQNMLVVKS